MIPVFQTDLSNETGDCLQACVASVLNLPLDEVPAFKRINALDPVTIAAVWLEDLEYKVVVTNAERLRYITTTEKIIVSVPSRQHKNKWHAVVAQIKWNVQYAFPEFILVHDPNPETTRIVGNYLSDVKLAILIYE